MRTTASRRAFLQTAAGGVLAMGISTRGMAVEADTLVAYSGARVFDGMRARDGAAVLVRGGRVVDVVPRSEVPEGAAQFHEPDCTLLPGLIDCHVHFMRWQGPQFIASGVTTVRDTGNDLNWILARREEAASKPWPRIRCLGPLLDGPTPVHERVCRKCLDLSDAVAAVRETAAAGVDGLKFYVGLDPAWIPAMAEAGHAAGVKISMHCAGGGVVNAASAGVDEFFHLDGILADIWPDRPRGWLNVWGKPDFEATHERQCVVADAIAASGITATPTLAYWDSQRRIRATTWHDSPDRLATPAPMLPWQEVASDASMADEWLHALLAAQRFVGLLLERGVSVLPGSDVPCGLVPPGLSLWRELAMLVEAGMTPTQALRSATRDAANFMRQEDLGRLERGALADLVFVRGNPLAQIPTQPDVVMTVHDGLRYVPNELLAMEATSLEDEPWAAQFELHWKHRTQA